MITTIANTDYEDIMKQQRARKRAEWLELIEHQDIASRMTNDRKRKRS